MRKGLLTLCGLVALLLAVSPASADLFYQSDLVCIGSPASGFAVIKAPTGDLYVKLVGGPTNAQFTCEIRCNDGTVLAASTDTFCGDRRSNAAGTLTTISEGLGVGTAFVPAVTECQNPVVRVTEPISGLVCVSGYATP
jgi:hypothetical protein